MIMKYKDFEITGSPEEVCYVMDHIQDEVLKKIFAADCSQITIDDVLASPEYKKTLLGVE